MCSIKHFFKNNYIVILFFFTILAYGFLIYSDYGSFYDESIERFSGAVNVKKILSSIDYSLSIKLFGDDVNKYPNIEHYKDRYYGVALQYPLYVLDFVFRDTLGLWAGRRLFQFLFFYLSLIAWYFVNKTVFESKLLSVMSVLFIIVNPRIFAESFYNVKDVGFMSSFMFASLFFMMFAKAPNYKNAVLLGLFSAFSTAVRILGIIPILSLVWLILYFLFYKKIRTTVLIKLSLVCLLTYASVVCLLYPASWGNPIVFFKEAFVYFSSHPWDGAILFFGEIYNSDQIPFYYLPTWIGITIPLFVLIMFLIGFVYGLSCLLSRIINGGADLKNVAYFYFISTSLGIVVLSVLVKPHMYDGWRHFYFIYPSIVFVSILAIEFFDKNLVLRFNNENNKWIVCSMVFVFMLHPIWRIIQLHPYQNVYFNELLRSKDIVLFERDYWGLAYKEGLEKLLKKDHSSIVKIKWDYNIPHAIELLDENQQKRISYDLENKSYDYIFDNFRAKKYSDTKCDNEYFSIQRGDIKLLSVVKSSNNNDK